MFKRCSWVVFLGLVMPDFGRLGQVLVVLMVLSIAFVIGMLILTLIITIVHTMAIELVSFVMIVTVIVAPDIIKWIVAIM